MKRCPACGYGNRSSAVNCKGCGDPLPEEAQKAAAENRWPQCYFHDDGRRCPLPSVWHGGADVPCCSYHSPHNSKKANIEILEDLLRNGPPRKPRWSDFVIDGMISGRSPQAAFADWKQRYAIDKR